MSRAVKQLIIINVALFVLIHLLPKFPWLALFGLVPKDVFAGFRIWQPATYMFLHLGLWHLVVNMLMLWFFGPAIERAWGRKQFLFYYFFTGVGAALCSWITALHSPLPVVGASGAIFGLLVAYAIMFPETIILFFFIFPMKIKHAVFVLAGINLLGAVSQPYAGVAYFAHLGGGLFGYLYLRNEWIRRQFAYWGLPDIRAWYRAKRAGRKQSLQKNLEEQADKILDKVSKEGINSLSRKERKTLEARSKNTH